MRHGQTAAGLIIADFLRLGHRSDSFAATMNLALSHPEQLSQLLHLGMEKTPEGATFFDAALGYLPEEDFPDVVSKTVAELQESRKNRLAESILAYAALQFPRFLHPYLDTIFELEANGGSYYENYPWRESDDSHAGYLTSAVRDEKQSPRLKLKAWDCLLETRDADVLKTALDLRPRVNLRHPISLYLEGIGFEMTGGEIRPLYNPAVHHLIFEKSYLADPERPLWLAKENHPTWRLEDENAQVARFGGAAEGVCGVCGGQLSHLLTFAPPIENSPVAGLRRLTLATCLSCLGWEEKVLFYRHDENGRPVSFGYEGGLKTPEFPAADFRETRVKIVKTPDRWAWQDWALSNSRENLHRLNGFPCWVQSSEHPPCPACEKKMTFLLQLDSDLPTMDSAEWLWGSGGICYCFWCEACRISAYLWQCT